MKNYLNAKIMILFTPFLIIALLPELRKEYKNSVVTEELDKLENPIKYCKEDCTICGWDCHIDYDCVDKCMQLKGDSTLKKEGLI